MSEKSLAFSRAADERDERAGRGAVLNDPAPVGREADELAHPVGHGLFELGERRSGLPGEAERAEPRAQEVAEHGGKLAVGREVAEEAGMLEMRKRRDDQRVHVAHDGVERLGRVGRGFRKGRAQGAGLRLRHDGPLRDRLPIVGDPVDQLVADPTEFLGRQRDSPLPGRGSCGRPYPIQKRQPACKPGSVWPEASPRRDGHSSGTPVAGRLKQPTRATGPTDGPATDCSPRIAPIRFCSRRGLPCRRRCRRRGALLPHPFTLAPAASQASGRSAFCGAFPGVAPAGRYPAPCPFGARTFLRPLGQRPSGRLAWHGYERPGPPVKGKGGGPARAFAACVPSPPRFRELRRSLKL